MQKKLLLFVLIVSVVSVSCWKKHEPSPEDEISSMAVSAKKVEEVVVLNIMAYAFKSHNGPEPTTFDEAEVWISEELAGFANMKLTYTTTEKTVKLENLSPDKTYYVAVKGIKKGVKTSFSKAIMFTTRSIKSAALILEAPHSFYMKSSGNNPYLAYVDDRTGELILQNWQDKSKSTLFKNTQSKTYQVKGFYAQGSRLFLETSNNNRDRAFEYYDIDTQKFVAIDIPTGARIWNYAFSSDGSKLAYTDYARQGLYIYDVNTKENKMFSSDNFYNFDWSADDKSIIVGRNKIYMGPTVREIVRYSIANQEQAPTQIFEWPDETMQWVMFSPKEEYMLFGSYIANSADLWVYEVKNKKLWQISDVANFGWLSDKDFFVSINKEENQASFKTYKYTMP